MAASTRPRTRCRIALAPYLRSKKIIVVPAKAGAQGQLHVAGPGFPLSRERRKYFGRMLFDDDPRRLALLQAELCPNPRGDRAIDFRVLALRLRHHDRVAFVRGFANGDVERQLAEELSALTPDIA